MKIGILTLPLHTNYGGILQAYALQTVLERMGHEVVVFNRDGMPSLPPYYKRPICYTLRLLKKILLKPNTIVRWEHIIRKEYPVVTQYTQRFINKYIHCCMINDIQEISKVKVDAIVVGSDQIWRPRYFAEMWHTESCNSFLVFTKQWNIRRYAYAASFGVDEWEYPQNMIDVLKSAAQQFDAISVREESGVDLCRKYLNVFASHVLDPTMLLEKEDYIQLIKKSNQPQSAGNLFCYILDKTPEKSNLIDAISYEKKLTPFYVKAEGLGKTSSISERIHKPVEAWIRGFYDAEFIITDSFHACVFSILFRKPFIVVGNKGRGFARFQSLLKMFSLERNLITSASEYNPVMDYSVPETTNDILDKLRNGSMSFLSQIKG